MLFHWKGLKQDGSEYASSLPVKGKTEIKTFLLKVPIMEYSSEVKLSLINDFIKDNNYFFQFKKWQCIRHLHVTGKALNFDITNPYRSVSNPSWAFVLFQAN